jgi:hypothetical protein
MSNKIYKAKTPKRYFEDAHDEICFNLDYFTDGMKEGESKVVYECVPEKISGYAWCSHFGEVLDINEKTCGKSCKFYEPRNGKSGCCKDYTTTFYGVGDAVVLSIQNDKIVITKANENN